VAHSDDSKWERHLRERFPEATERELAQIIRNCRAYFQYGQSLVNVRADYAWLQMRPLDKP
jgi:hypothetical protein